MRLLQLTPGTGNFHCGSCLRDHALIRGLRARGHDAQMVPLYLPPVLDSPDGSEDHPVFFGGINAYLQQKSALFRATPRWLDALFDARGLLRSAARFAGMTDPKDLGAMTLSMLQGEEGRQHKELDRLVSWLERDGRPELVGLSNVLLIGMARKVKAALDVPVVCALQGEDSFLDSLPEPYKTDCWELLRERARDIDAFLPVSETYGQLMTERLQLDPARVQVVHNGIDLSGFEPAEPPAVPTIGYLARMCPPKGLHLLVDAFVSLCERGRVPDARLRIAGAKTPADEEYVAKAVAHLTERGLGSRVEVLPNISREDKQAFLRGLSLLSVPALYGESFGLYVVEALACGVPVVQPDHGAFPELIGLTGGGRIFDHEAPLGYVEALEALLLDPDEARRLGAAGREVVLSRFTREAMAEAADAVLTRVLASAPQRG